MNREGGVWEGRNFASGFWKKKHKWKTPEESRWLFRRQIVQIRRKLTNTGMGTGLFFPKKTGTTRKREAAKPQKGKRGDGCGLGPFKGKRHHRGPRSVRSRRKSWKRRLESPGTGPSRQKSGLGGGDAETKGTRQNSFPLCSRTP